MELIMNFLSNFNEKNIIDLLIAIIIIAVFNMLSPLFSYVIVKIFNFKKNRRKIKQNAFYRPIKSFFKISGIYIAILFLKPTFNLSENFLNICTKIYKISVILATATAFANSLTINSKFVKVIKEKSEKDIDEGSTTVIIKIIRFLIYAIATFMIIADLGYDLSGLITGLGLGSVVLTLAAQDTAKNLFAGMMIFMDKHFKAGDYIKFGTNEGTVEDISFRSTKIRTLQNSIAQIPNSEITNTVVVNLSKIEKRRYELDLGVVLSTELSKISKLKDNLILELSKKDYIEEGSINVFFNKIESNSFNISLFFYVMIANYTEYLKLKEELNFEIMNIINKNNIELAYDTKTIKLEKV